MSPWIVGFAVFFGYPLVTSVYLSFTHYDLLSPPRWIGLGELPLHVRAGPADLAGGEEHAVDDRRVAVPLQVLFAFGVALMLARARRGVGVFRTIFYLPALAPPVAATLGFVYILNPATGPVNTLPRPLGIQGPLWFQSPEWAKPSLVLLGLWGVGNLMIIFLAAVLDVPRHLYESAELDGAGRAAAAALRDAAGDQPGDPVRRRHRRHPGAAVLHPGVRGGEHRRRARPRRRATRRVNLGYPEDSTLFYPVLLYQQGFRYFQMGYASAMAMVLLAVSFAVTLVILLNSRRWVHYAGSASDRRRARRRSARAAQPAVRGAPRGAS